ncbi:MAG: ROK family protein, partial [Clostridia bacterium]|nr:ROK family protein [Clostridia bacterium]
MERFGIRAELKNQPALDPSFFPLYRWEEAYLKGATEKIAVALVRESGKTCVCETAIYGTEEMREADCFHVERLVKFLLWAKGGYRVIICGNEKIFAYIRDTYAAGGARAFDFKTMGDVYENAFTVEHLPYDQRPREVDASQKIGGHTDGCRIGFDAGGSDRKVSAVIDGKCVYSEEVVWFPKTESDPDYHFKGIVEALKTAASKMPRVDAVGVSSAGIFVNDRTMLSSLFLKVPKEDFDKKV